MKCEIGKRLHYTFDEHAYDFVCVGIEEDRALFISNEHMGKSEFGEDNKWRTSSLRSYLYYEFYDDLQTVLGDEWLTVETEDCEDNLFCLSKEEYDKYKDNIIECSNVVGASWWWLRSPCTDNYTYAFFVSNHGLSYYSGYTGYSGGVVCAFWIKNVA